MLYDLASNLRPHCLYICPVANVLGSTPLIPCFIGGNSHTTISHSFKDDLHLGSASADTQQDRGNGSRLYEVNIWIWRSGWAARGARLRQHQEVVGHRTWCPPSPPSQSRPCPPARAKASSSSRAPPPRPCPQSMRHQSDWRAGLHIVRGNGFEQLERC
jgi:hypothetical protein